MTNPFHSMTRSFIGIIGAVLLATTCFVAAAGPAQVSTAQVSTYLAA